MPVTSTAHQRTIIDTAAANNSTDNAAEAEGEASGGEGPSRPDSNENCSICLGPFDNTSFTNSCVHSFCFICLKQWLKVKAECPLCKKPFTGIFHNIRSNQDYDVYNVPRIPANQHITYDFNNITPSTGTIWVMNPRHQNRLTLRYRNDFSSYLAPTVNQSTYVSAHSWPRGARDFRREVYRRFLAPPSIIVGTENSDYILTPAMVQTNDHIMQRIMPWLARELKVLLYSPDHIRLAMSTIQPLLFNTLITSELFRESVSPFIGVKSLIFIEEFMAFANSDMDMETYDRAAWYLRREDMIAFCSSSSNSLCEVTDSFYSSSDDDVVEATDISPVDPPSTRSTTQTAPFSYLLETSDWDSPHQGPSWSNMTASATDVPSSANQKDYVSVSSESEDNGYMPALHDSYSKAGSDIVFVKYDKPWNERSTIPPTPYSDGEDEQMTKKKTNSKCKRKRMLSPDSDKTLAPETSQKDKTHKAYKSKSKNKEMPRPCSVSLGNVLEQESSSVAVGSKMRMSASSKDKHSSK